MAKRRKWKSDGYSNINFIQRTSIVYQSSKKIGDGQTEN